MMVAEGRSFANAGLFRASKWHVWIVGVSVTCGREFELRAGRLRLRFRWLKSVHDRNESFVLDVYSFGEIDNLGRYVRPGLDSLTDGRKVRASFDRLADGCEIRTKVRVKAMVKAEQSPGAGEGEHDDGEACADHSPDDFGPGILSKRVSFDAGPVHGWS